MSDRSVRIDIETILVGSIIGIGINVILNKTLKYFKILYCCECDKCPCNCHELNKKKLILEILEKLKEEKDVDTLIKKLGEEINKTNIEENKHE